MSECKQLAEFYLSITLPIVVIISMFPIYDHTLAVQIRFENPSYVVAEDSGNVTVCATATGQLVRDAIVTLTTADDTAMGELLSVAKVKTV